MKYIYILNENNICIEIRNFYETDKEFIEKQYKDCKHIIKDENMNVLNYQYKYETDSFIEINHNNTISNETDIILAQILLDIQKLKLN